MAAGHRGAACSWGIGFSLFEALATWAALHGRPAPAFARHVDLAAGFASKHVDVVLAPVSMSGSASGTGLDLGVLLRVSPLVPRAGVPVPLRVDLSYGHSVLDFNDEESPFLDEDETSPLTRSHRNGIAGRVALGVPAGLRAGASPAVGWLLDSLDPLVSFGVAHDWEHNSAGGRSVFDDVDRDGLDSSADGGRRPRVARPPRPLRGRSGHQRPRALDHRGPDLPGRREGARRVVAPRTPGPCPGVGRPAYSTRTTCRVASKPTARIRA